jgi:cell division protein ZapA (FtsZ GTPase activity inhibitor)
MNTEAKKYTLTILGQAYTVITDEPELLVVNAARLLDSLMKEIAQKAKNIDGQKVAVLAALQCASKLLACQALQENVSKRELELILAIDREIMQLSL